MSSAIGVGKSRELHLITCFSVTKKLAGKDKSSKHIKAEKLMANGVPIRILKESDFKELVDSAIKTAQ